MKFPARDWPSPSRGNARIATAAGLFRDPLNPESFQTTDGRGAAGLVERLRRLPDPQARLQLAVDLARARTGLPDALRTDAHRVHGCLVRLWFVATLRDGRCWFATDSDAVSLKALVGLLCDLNSGLRPEEIAARPTAVLEELGLLRQLAENRRATILRVADAMRAFADGGVIAVATDLTTVATRELR